MFFSEFGNFLFETEIKMWLCYLQITVTYDETSEMADMFISVQSRLRIVFVHVCVCKTECKS